MTEHIVRFDIKDDEKETFDQIVKMMNGEEIKGFICVEFGERFGSQIFEYLPKILIGISVEIDRDTHSPTRYSIIATDKTHLLR